MPNLTEEIINELQRIADIACSAFAAAARNRSAELGAVARELFCSLDDALTDVEGGNPLDAKWDPGNPLHTYRLQLATGSLTSDLISRGKLRISALTMTDNEVAQIYRNADSYISVKQKLDSIGLEGKYDLVLKALDYARRIHPKPTLASAAISN